MEDGAFFFYFLFIEIFVQKQFVGGVYFLNHIEKWHQRGARLNVLNLYIQRNL